MNNGNIIGAMAVGALLAPVTGGASLAVALAGVSAGSIISKMGEEWEEDTSTTEEVETETRTNATTFPTTASQGRDVNIGNGYQGEIRF